MPSPRLPPEADGFPVSRPAPCGPRFLGLGWGVCGPTSRPFHLDLWPGRTHCADLCCSPVGCSGPGWAAGCRGSAGLSFQPQCHQESMIQLVFCFRSADTLVFLVSLEPGWGGGLLLTGFPNAQRPPRTALSRGLTLKAMTASKHPPSLLTFLFRNT